MILVDTSVWIDHLRYHDDALMDLLNTSQVLMHPYIVGELACGNLTNRTELLHLLAALPQISTALDKEVLFFIEQRSLMGKGIGYIDAHLLAAVALDGTARIWTQDKQLHKVAETLPLACSLARDINLGSESKLSSIVIIDDSQKGTEGLNLN